MRYFLPALALLVAQLCIAQEQPIKKNAEVELIEKQTVTLEYSNLPMQETLTDSGFVYVTAGNMTGYLSEFEAFFREYLVANHEIGYRFYGCALVGAELKDMMASNAKISQEYGSDFIAEERSKAKALFEKRA